MRTLIRKRRGQPGGYTHQHYWDETEAAEHNNEPLRKAAGARLFAREQRLEQLRELRASGAPQVVVAAGLCVAYASMLLSASQNGERLPRTQRTLGLVAAALAIVVQLRSPGAAMVRGLTTALLVGLAITLALSHDETVPIDRIVTAYRVVGALLIVAGGGATLFRAKSALAVLAQNRRMKGALLLAAGAGLTAFLLHFLISRTS